jgi:photosystem II stability/assembly factor-like uncharacterized protein
MKNSKFYSLAILFLFSISHTSCKKLTDKDKEEEKVQEWNKIATVQGGQPRRIFFSSDNIGYICGLNNGFLAKTVDGGSTWTKLNTPGTQGIVGSMNAIHFLNDNVGYVSINDDYGRIFKTTDGGQSWSISCPKMIGTTFINTITDIYFSDINNGVGIAYYGNIVYTNDAGDTWNFANIDNVLGNVLFSALSFVNKDIAYVVGSSSTILKTIDGGMNWTTLNNYHLNTTVNNLASIHFDDIHAFDENNILISSSGGGVYRTTNAGVSWVKVSDFSISAIEFDTPTHGFLSTAFNNSTGITLLETSDAGQTFKEISFKDEPLVMRDFVMVKPGLGYGFIMFDIYRYIKD